jgi:epoxide hydrolase-like predicted phosphatase
MAQDMESRTENNGKGTIDTVIFDIGGVLVELGRYRFLAKKGFTGELAERVMKATMRSEDWVQLDLNNISEEEILDLFIENDPEIEQEIRHMYSNLIGIVETKASSLPWLRRIKASGRRVLFLSNYSRKIMREAPECFYFLPAMDGGIFSCDVHLVKPDPAIYQELIRRYDLAPERCVFIDDLRSNLEPAEKLGFRTLLFQSQEQAEKDLAGLLL